MFCFTSIFFFLLSSELIILNNGQMLDFNSELRDREIQKARQISADEHRFFIPDINNWRDYIQKQAAESVRTVHDNDLHIEYNMTKSGWSQPIVSNTIRDSVRQTQIYLANLQEKIAQKVEDRNRMIVYEREVRSSMRNGWNGITIATYRPFDKTLIAKDGRLFECSGQISDKGTCSVDLKPFAIKTLSDNCFLSSTLVINDQVCLQTGNPAPEITTIPGGITCWDVQGDKIEPMTVEKYKELCKNVVQETDFKYITTKKLSRYTPKDIKCATEYDPTVCTFTQKKRFPKDREHPKNYFI